MKPNPLLTCYMHYIRSMAAPRWKAAWCCSLIRARIFSSPSTTRLFCRFLPPLIFLQFCCRRTRHRWVESVKFKPEERSRRHPACCGFFSFFTYLNSWTHHDRSKQINSVGQKINCESWIKKKGRWKNELSWWCLEYDGCPWRHFRQWPFYTAEYLRSY